MTRGARAVIVAALICCSSSFGQVVLRSGERLEGAVTEISLAGVRVSPGVAGEAIRVVSWDQVKTVEGTLAEQAKSFAQVKDHIWRARTRVERLDMVAAEPLLNELQKTYAAESGPSATLIADCLTRCQLARGAHRSAVSSWLWWVALQEQHAAKSQAPQPTWVGGAVGLAPLTERGTVLVASLPPVWLADRGGTASTGVAEFNAGRTAVGMAGELAQLYEKGAAAELDLTQPINLGDPPSANADVALVREIVVARAGAPEARAAAREALRQRLALLQQRRPENAKAQTPLPRWMEAWCRVGLGRSLVRESERQNKINGVLELLHLPARFGADQPYLTGIALAEAAVTMAELGDVEAAAALKNDLMTSFPGHPARVWESLEKVSLNASSPASVTETRMLAWNEPGQKLVYSPALSAVDAPIGSRRLRRGTALQKGCA